MADSFAELTPELTAFIEKQALFFVATAPGGTEGHVNVSPKGLDCFCVLDPKKVAYLDITGSGNETAAHITENGRITFLFCSFDREPLILRLYGTGRAVLPGTVEFEQLAPRFQMQPGTRQFIVADLLGVKTSCGFGVPLMELVNERTTLTRWAESKGEGFLSEYRAEKNAVSIDGLPAPIRQD